MTELKATYAEVLAILYQRESDPNATQYVVSSNRNDHNANLVNFNTLNRMERLGLVEIFSLRAYSARAARITERGREAYMQHDDIEAPAPEQITNGVERRTVTLPLEQIIQVYPGFWFCCLCTHPGRPGLGRHWSATARAEAEAVGVKHLREHHGLTAVGHQP